jgi:hypothetical protein
MSIFSRQIIAVAWISGLAGCASVPTAPKPPVAAVPVSAQPAAATQPAPASPSAAAEAEATAKMAASLGYVPRKRDGAMLYCRTEPQIGSHFETTTCIMAEQVVSAAKRSEGNRDSVEAMQRKSLLQGAGN